MRAAGRVGAIGVTSNVGSDAGAAGAVVGITGIGGGNSGIRGNAAKVEACPLVRISFGGVAEMARPSGNFGSSGGVVAGEGCARLVGTGGNAGIGTGGTGIGMGTGFNTGSFGVLTGIGVTAIGAGGISGNEGGGVSIGGVGINIGGGVTEGVADVNECGAGVIDTDGGVGTGGVVNIGAVGVGAIGAGVNEGGLDGVKAMRPTDSGGSVDTRVIAGGRYAGGSVPTLEPSPDDTGTGNAPGVAPVSEYQFALARGYCPEGE